MEKLRIGLIGFGTWARNAYLPALQYDGRTEVTAVTASSEKTRCLAREVLGRQTAVFENYQELLSQGEVDAVMLAVPDHVHEAALTAAIESGIPVFYEPPLAHTRKQIPIMVNQLLAASQVTCANIELGYHSGIGRMAELIKSSTIGSLHNVTINLYADWDCSQDSDVCLLNRMSCWYVDVLNRIIGKKPSRVLMLEGHTKSGRMQPISTGIYDYNGVWGFIKANVYSPEGVSITIEAGGDNGDIYMDYFSGELRYRTMQHRDWIVEECVPLKPYANWPGVRESVSAFLDAVVSKKQSMGNAQAIAELNLIGLAAEESKDSGGWAQVK